ncbi:hypothetical protein [Aeromicrobium sp. CTD01-1L150]|uniref:hypothetical protein n=1 Tax=Aeromicrobium sp. CTD01-1L150 TaxID=3341830 RepID=UPI0035C0656C
MARRKTQRHETTIAEVVALIDAQHPKSVFAPDVDDWTEHADHARQVRTQRHATLAEHGYTTLDELFHRYPRIR